MVSSLRLQNFRSYSDKTFKFDPLTNVIVGPNTIGKTNIIEALLVSRTGSSHRAKDINLISFNKQWLRIEAYDNNIKRVVKISNGDRLLKAFEINDKLYKRLPTSLKLPIVFFEPNHLQLLNGSPEGRRAYLDSLIGQIDENYNLLIKKYLRVLAQRNSLLKKHSLANEFFPWNIRLSQFAGRIVAARNKTIKQINNYLPATYNRLSGDNIKTSINYLTQLPIDNYETSFLKKLEINLEVDLKSGFTLIGPHRDDFVFMFNTHQANNYASRGELRTAVLALKIIELEIIKNQLKLEPIILLDDVYSELDSLRRRALTKSIKDNQTFITTTDADSIKNHFSKTSQMIKLS